ncbi:Aspartyl protease [Actinidia chinensis var. chinensis]|uniref:Aspartyl protease n=1 Tax=Actinidia chinensis var. chinensis TaxID=1590841 RepID=A0A2R6QKM1_ACTCC|nr:Aspartyl protease [Actinidia chinensis var. chinensis]
MATSLSLLLLLLLLSLFSLSPSLSQALTPKCSTLDHGSTLQVLHVNSPCSPFKTREPVSWRQDVVQMQSKDLGRLQYLASLVAGKSVVPIASGRQIVQSPTYIVRARFGNPPQTLLMAVDTSNDAAWVPCSGCVGCAATVFDFATSDSFKSLGCQDAQCNQVPNPTCTSSTCSYTMTYGGSTVAANLSQDTIMLANDSVPAYTFGCIQKTTGTSVPPQGLLGLGREPLSLLSQTQSLYQSTFSYCLPSFKSGNFSGSLILGPIGQPKKIKYTQLLKNPRRSSLYYVNMTGIRVGRRVVNIPQTALAFNTTTGAGTIIDSGTVYTRLVQPAYIAVREEFRRLVDANVSSLGGFDTCYTVPIVAPNLTFIFSGMNMKLPPDNYLLRSTAGSTTCLAMAAAPNNVNSVLNVIANLQQQNHRILFDVPNSRLGIARETCT